MMKNNTHTGTWSLFLEQPDSARTLIHSFAELGDQTKEGTWQSGAISVRWTLDLRNDYWVLTASANANTDSRCFLTLAYEYTSGTPYTFHGPVLATEVYRQSPHDIDAWIAHGVPRQGVPMVAVQNDAGFTVAVSDTPAHYENYTSQGFYLEEGILCLSSGDTGASPGIKPAAENAGGADYNKEKNQRFSPGRIEAHYQPISKDQTHTFQAIIFNAPSGNLATLRRDVNRKIARHFSKGDASGTLGSLAFTSAYMNLRRNETGKSTYWVVPSIEYSNVQYCRDAFWIATMLPPDYDAECLKNELAALNHYAEYPLFVLIWAWRNHKRGFVSDTGLLQTYVDSIEDHMNKAWFHAYDEDDGRHDFQYWCDQLSFQTDDAISYNQGLAYLALRAARAMGLATKTDPEMALQNYRSLFNTAGGFMPISRLKNGVLGPDPVLPDLLAQMYFDEKLLSDAQVQAHFSTMVRAAKTEFGFKVICQPDGSYPPDAWYNIPQYTAQANKGGLQDGAYVRGGSWLLYDGVFLLGAALRGIAEARALLLWRIEIELETGGTTFEYLNTKTGEAHKPNMGWNIAVYAFARDLVRQGKLAADFLTDLDKLDLSQKSDAAVTQLAH